MLISWRVCSLFLMELTNKDLPHCLLISSGHKFGHLSMCQPVPCSRSALKATAASAVNNNILLCSFDMETGWLYCLFIGSTMVKNGESLLTI